jgi:hypothetical protein
LRGERGNAEFGGDEIGDAPFAVGGAVGFFEEDFLVASDEQDTSELLSLDVVVGDAVHFWDGVLSVANGDGGEKGDRLQE